LNFLNDLNISIRSRRSIASLRSNRSISSLAETFVRLLYLDINFKLKVRFASFSILIGKTRRQS